MPVVDLSNVELMNFDALPRGEYRVAVDQAEVRQANSSGEDNVLWVLKVTDVLRVRGDDVNLGALVGRIIPHGTSLQPKSLWNFYRTAVALGEDPEEIKQPDFDINDEYLSKFLGEECVVTLRTRDYEGRETNQVVNIRALSEKETMSLK